MAQKYPLKVMQLGPTLYQGGVAVAIKNITKGLIRAGHQVMLVGNGGNFIDELVEMGVLYQEVTWSQKLPKLLKCVQQVRCFIQTFQPDIIHVHGRGPSLVCTLSGRKPEFLTFHNSKFTEQIGWFDKGYLRRILSPMAHRVQVLTPEAIPYLNQHLGIQEEDIVLIGNGVDCDVFYPPTEEERNLARAKFEVNESETLAMFVGRFHEQKQPEAMVFLAEAAKAEGLNNVKFALVGSGHLEENLRQLIQSKALAESCKLYGWMEPKEAYWAADIIMMPSLYEGFACVPTEALACGIPVYRTRTGGYEQTIVENITGFSPMSTSPDEFVKKGLEILRYPEKFRLMCSSARQWAIDKLSLEHQTEQTVKAYQDYLHTRKL